MYWKRYRGFESRPFRTTEGDVSRSHRGDSMSDTPQQVADSSGEDEAGIRNVLAGDVNAFATLEREVPTNRLFLGPESDPR